MGLLAQILALVEPGLPMELIGGEVEIAARRNRERVRPKNSWVVGDREIRRPARSDQWFDQTGVVRRPLKPGQNLAWSLRLFGRCRPTRTQV
jgi:hypothetical protein